MIELIKKLLEEFFSDYKKYFTIVLIIFTVIIAVIQLFQAIWISKTIEKFKTSLRKSEVKFSRFNSLQVDALKSIYTKLVYFHAANNYLFNVKDDDTGHHQFKNRINNWIKTYIECVNEFSREKLLLPNNLKDLIQRTLVDFEEVKNKITAEKEILNYIEEEAQGRLEEMYEFAENELSVINEKIRTLKSQKDVENSEKNIKELRKTIEDYFEEMNK